MSWERTRILLFKFRMLAYMLVHTKTGLLLGRLRRNGREAEAEAIVERLVTGWARDVLKHLRCDLEVEGLEHVPQGEAFVVYVNHQSQYDIPALLSGLNRAIGFVVKRELLWIPVLNFWMRQIHCLFIDRRDITGGAQSLRELAADLKRLRRGFIIFPEGTRTRDPQRTVQPFRRGALRLAAEADLPVLPVAIDGAYLLDSPQAMAASQHGGRRIRMRIEPLRRLEGTSAPQRRDFMDALYETIRSNREAIRVEWPTS